MHEALVKEHLGQALIGHISRDGTAIAAREKPARKEKTKPVAQAKRGRARKDEVREPKLKRDCATTRPELDRDAGRAAQGM